jgi:DNA-binding MarR family transcriptional regulator
MLHDDKSPFDLGPASELEPSVRAFRTVLVLAHRLRYLMDERLRVDGLTTQQAALLTVVNAAGGPSLTEAAAALGSTHQNVAQLVTALVRKGMLAEAPDPDDRRRKRLTVTATSARYWAQRDADDAAAVAGWFGALTDDEVQTLCRLADRVLADLSPSAGAVDRGDVT